MNCTSILKSLVLELTQYFEGTHNKEGTLNLIDRAWVFNFAGDPVIKYESTKYLITTQGMMTMKVFNPI